MEHQISDAVLELEVLRAEARYLQTEPLDFRDFKNAVVDGVTTRIDKAKAEMRDRLIRRVTHANLPEQFPERQLSTAADVVEQVETYLCGGFAATALALLPPATIRNELDSILQPLQDTWPRAGDLQMTYAERQERLREITAQIHGITAHAQIKDGSQ